MKKIIIFLLALMPFLGVAQSGTFAGTSNAIVQARVIKGNPNMFVLNRQPSDGKLYLVGSSLILELPTSETMVTTARTLTLTQGTGVNITGGTQDLSANRTWTIALPQSVATSASPTFVGINLTGNLSVGTTYIGKKLDVKSSGAVGLLGLYTSDYVNNSTGSSLAINSGATTGNTNFNIQAFTSGGGDAGDIIINSGGGNVGIGGTPSNKLHVAGNAFVTGTIVANGTVIGSNLSGTNSGDNAVNTLYSGLASSKQDVLTNPVTGTGTGTVDYLPKFSAATGIANSAVYENSGNVSIGGTFAIEQLNVSSASAGRMAVDDAGGTNRYSLLFQSPTSTNQYGIIRAYKYGTGAGYKNLVLQDGGGNVGIANTAPTEKLHVTGNILASGTITATTSATSPIWYGGSGTTSSLTLNATSGTSATGADVIVKSGSAELARFLQNGNVGFGTASPNQKVDVNGNIKVISASGGGAYYSSTSSADASARNWVLRGNSISYGDFDIRQSGAVGGDPIAAGTSRFYINPTGNIGIGTASPSGILHAASTTSFVLLCPMSSSQKGALTGLVAGAEIYCTDCTATDSSTGVKQVYNGSTWKNCW